MEFGYLFAGSQAGDAITEMVVNDNDLLCLGSIHNGESMDWAVELFQIEGYTDLLTDGVEWETQNGKYLAFSGDIQGSGIPTYQEEKKRFVFSLKVDSFTGVSFPWIWNRLLLPT